MNLRDVGSETSVNDSPQTDKIINKRQNVAQQHQKKMLKYNKIIINLQKDYNYNQIDGYFA
jgi:hypothetical protein